MSNAARRFVIAVIAIMGVAAVYAGSAWAESCSYGNGRVQASLTPGSEATLVVSGTEIRFGQVPVACDGATTTNTNVIEIDGGFGAADRLTIDQTSGTFTPGATAEGDAVSEIEIVVELFDGYDTVVVKGTAGNDIMRLGENGLRLFADNDADITFAGPRAKLEFEGLGGADEINALGGGGAGAAYLGPVTISGGEGNDTLLRGSASDDLIQGGPGNDILDGQGGADRLVGADGADRLDGGPGNDWLEGGTDADIFFGRDGDDVLNAFDDPAGADPTLNGGLNADTAYLDASDNPTGTPGVETVIVGSPPGPPPPPATPCTYSAPTRELTINIEAGTEPSLAVAGEQFVFDAEACPDATLSNTDRVNVYGVAGAPDQLTIMVSSALMAEDLFVDLRDASDIVRIVGGPGQDHFVLGEEGFDGDEDGFVDIELQHWYLVELDGGGGTGRNFLTAHGGEGGQTGGSYFGRVRLYAGDGGDTLRGTDHADELFGGAGHDFIHGYRGNDMIEGGAGNDDLRGDEDDDTMRGGDGNDELLGAEGVDSLAGGEGDDVIDARRPASVPGQDLDAAIDGGPGTDTAYVDPGEGIRVTGVETLIGDTQTPPPSNACEYDALTGQVDVQLGAGTQAAFKVVGTEIWLDGAACAGATTTSTSRIVVTGLAGSAEQVTIDERGGRFAPGHVNEAVSPEVTDAPGLSEIEFHLDLGNDAGDTIVVHGTAGDDTIAIGQKGLILDTDGDTDVFVPLANPTLYTVDIHGEGGLNRLSAGGAQGAGATFYGKARLYAGGLGDTLIGGGGADELYGGAGADALDGGEGSDLMLGGGGGDTLRGYGGADDMTGGAGADTLIGGTGADTLRAGDDEADINLSGGADSDTAYYDAGLDPNPSGVETKIPD